MTTYMIISFVLFVLGLLLFIYGIRFGVLLGHFETCAIISFLIVVAGLIVLWVGYFVDSAHFNEKLQAAKNDSSITWYLDGEIIDVENIDLNQYECSFNEDETKVFITKR